MPEIMKVEDELIQCPVCGQLKASDPTNPHMCVDCARAETDRRRYIQSSLKYQWMDVAKESGLPLWVRQPGETQWEYSIWCAFRDQYPGKKPTYLDVAKKLNTTYAVVSKIASRWSFNTRLQAWIAEEERVTLAQRRQEILDMNKDHVDMARRLRSKLSVAIDALEPTTMKPSDITSLARLAADMERKAMLDSIEQTELRSALVSDQENPNIKKSPTKQSDLGEVVGILLKAGALGDITQIGVKQTTTTTTQLALADDNGNIAGATLEGK